MNASWYDIRAVTDQTAEVSIYDEVGAFGVTAKEFANSLQGLGNRRLTVRIHSPGGDVFQGNGIFNALRRHKGGVDVAIDGLAASMATVIAMAGDTRSMAENAMFMIHNPISFTAGSADELRKESDLLDDIKETFITVYASRTGLSREKLSEMMDYETWMNAYEAKELGFVTHITEPLNFSNSFKRFDISRFRKRPTNFMSDNTTPIEEAAPEPEVEVAPEVKAEEPESEAAEVLVIEAKASESPAFDIEAQVSAVAALHAREIAAKDSQIVALQECIADKDSCIAKLQECLATETSEKVALQDRLKKTSEALSLEQTRLSQLEASKGLAPAAVIPEIPQAETKSLFEQWNALEGAEATAFYKAHQKELLPYSVTKA